MRRSHAKDLLFCAWRDTVRLVGGQTAAERNVRLLGAVVLVVASYGYVRLVNPQSHAFADAIQTLRWATVVLVLLWTIVFLYFFCFEAPYQTIRSHQLRAEGAEIEVASSAPRIANLQQQLAAAAGAAQAARAQSTDYKQRLEEIRPYLEMLQAEHKLAKFDDVCPPYEIPAPPQPTGDEDADRLKWGMFAEGVRELMKGPRHSEGLHGLSVLDEAAYERILNAGKSAKWENRRPEETGVGWPADEAVRMEWLVLARRVEQIRIERDEAKKRLTEMADELTRARKLEEVLQRLPKEEGGR